jgi:hypothetical protein
MSILKRLFRPKIEDIPASGPDPQPAPPAPTPAAPRIEAPPPSAAAAPRIPPPAPDQAPSPAAPTPERAARWQNVYDFISSTFNDMLAERDYLVKQVFPQLQKWCDRGPESFPGLTQSSVTERILLW